MLAGLRPGQLAPLITPLGELTKHQTRALAHEFGLDVAAKPDSTDLCFVDGDYRSFILARFPDAAQPGPLLTTDGRRVGTHDGLLGYTVGQRRGIEASAAGDGPWYVVRTDRCTNAVIIGRREELARSSVACSAVNVLRPDRVGADGSVTGVAMCRYRSAALPATATIYGDAGSQRMTVQLHMPVPMVSPGQLLVMYDDAGDEVLCSGIIEAD
jgi:tRNA-specific 2-thiouridylase